MAGRSSKAGPEEHTTRDPLDSSRGSINNSVRFLVRTGSTHTEVNAEGLRGSNCFERPTLQDLAALPAASASRPSASPLLAPQGGGAEEPAAALPGGAEEPRGGEEERSPIRAVSLAIATYNEAVQERFPELHGWFEDRIGTKTQFLLMAVFILADAARFSTYEMRMRWIHPTAAFVLLNGSSALLSAAIAVALEGRAGWEKLWTWSRLGRSLEPAACFAVAQLLLGYAFRAGLSASQSVTLGFVYMPLAMLQASGVLRRAYGRLEWLSMAMLTVSVLTFVLVLEQGRQHPGRRHGRPGIGILDSAISIAGVLYVLLAAAISAMGSTLAERQMKDWHNVNRQRLDDRFYIHKFHLDVGALLVSLGFWLLPKGESQESLSLSWWWALPAVLAALAQSWLAALVARHFSTVAKAVAQSIAVVVVFFALARGPSHERHILVGARYTFCLASLCLGLIVVASACLFQTGRLSATELAGAVGAVPPQPQSAGRGTVTAAPGAEASGEVEQTARPSLSDELLRYSLLVLLVCADAGRELTRQWALGGGTVIVFQSVTVMNSICSIAVASLMAAFSDGLDGMKMAWDLRKIVRCSVVAVFFSLAATLGNMAYVFGVTATVSTILGYFYMPLSAIVGRWVLNRYYVWMEWSALLIVTLASVAYSMLETYARGESEQSEGSSSSLAMSMVLTSVVLSVLGSLVSERILQGERLPFCVQKVHLEVGSLVTAVGVLLLMPFVTQRRLDMVWCERPVDVACSAASPACTREPEFCAGSACECACGAGVLVGWDHRIVLLLCLNISQAWIGGLVAKYTSTVHKGVAQCCSLLVIYVVGRTLMPQSSGPSSTAMTMVTLIVPLSVVLFQCAAAETQKVWQARTLRLQAQRGSRGAHALPAIGPSAEAAVQPGGLEMVAADSFSHHDLAAQARTDTEAVAVEPQDHPHRPLA